MTDGNIISECLSDTAANLQQSLYWWRGDQRALRAAEQIICARVEFLQGLGFRLVRSHAESE